MVLMDSAWIEPSSKRDWTAFLTRRCWSRRLRPSNWGAATVARRWSEVPVSSTTSTSDAGQGGLDQQPDLGDGDGHQADAPALAASTISSTLQNLIRGRPWGSPAATSAASMACQPS